MSYGVDAHNHVVKEVVYSSTTKFHPRFPREVEELNALEDGWKYRAVALPLVKTVLVCKIQPLVSELKRTPMEQLCTEATALYLGKETIPLFQDGRRGTTRPSTTLD